MSKRYRNYIIVGDTEKYGRCLVYVCASEEDANRTLERMSTNPDALDKKIMKTHTNLRVDKVEDESCWWDDPFLSN